MKSRGRVSAEARSTPGLQYPHERPEPPPELNERQAREWRAIVGRMPAGWFLRETHSMLVSLVRLVDRSDFVAVRLNEMQNNKQTGSPDYAALVNQEMLLGRAIASLETKMRITQQSSSSEYKMKTGTPRPPGRPPRIKTNGDDSDQGWDDARQRRLNLGSD